MAPTETVIPASPPIQRVLIIGAGWTGRQIAGQMASHGLDVTLDDSNASALDVSRTWILDQRESFFEQGYWPDVSHDQLAGPVTVLRFSLRRFHMNTDDTRSR